MGWRALMTVLPTRDYKPSFVDYGLDTFGRFFRSLAKMEGEISACVSIRIPSDTGSS